jgi:hypothetical protein
MLSIVYCTLVGRRILYSIVPGVNKKWFKTWMMLDFHENDLPLNFSAV